MEHDMLDRTYLTVKHNSSFVHVYPLPSAARTCKERRVLGMTVFGTYEYLIQHYMKVNDDTNNARSTVLVHMGAGACVGLVQSSVLTSWELISKLTSHHGGMVAPHNWRGSFLARRAVHHAIGYASLSGTVEAARRVLLHCASCPPEETQTYSIFVPRPWRQPFWREAWLDRYITLSTM
jgi:hypothetical protein